jgi:molybdopterin molybdotransferase
MRPLPEAQRDVLEAVALLPEMEVPLVEALGLATTRAIAAPHDVPPFSNSAMDGYAVIAADVASPPVRLTVIEDVPAGSVPTMRVTPGTAIKIMTGAPLPDGADAVVQVEHTLPGDGEVTVHEATPLGTAVRAAGGDLPAGTPVIDAGVRLTPAHLGVLASIGVPRPPVRRRPVAAVMSTGDEVLPPDAELGPGKIRDSNRPMLRGLLAEAGAIVLDLGIVGDDADELRAALAEATERADVVVTSGGVSMGEYDLVKEVLGELGQIDFWQVAMQPAKPFAFGLLGSTPLFGLPGNPVSSMVAFEQFVRPALLRMMGSHLLFRPRVTGHLDDDVETAPEKTVFLRVATEFRAGGLRARLSGGQASNVLSALALADAFAVVPVGVGELPAGSPVELELFRQPEGRSASEALDG